MSILESVLRNSNAEDFIETFNQQGVDATVLPLLTDDDLKLLGIDDSNIRKTILKQSANLQTPVERYVDLTITEEYVQTVLQQLVAQLNLHHANLACTLRNDVVVCDIKLAKACECLLKCVNSFELKLNQLHQKIYPRQKKKKSKWKRTLLLVSSTTFIFLMGLKLLK